MSPASAFILVQALAPEVSWGRGRGDGQVEGVWGEDGTAEKAIGSQKRMQRWEGQDLHSCPAAVGFAHLKALEACLTCDPLQWISGGFFFPWQNQRTKMSKRVLW